MANFTEEDVKLKLITPAIQASEWDLMHQVRCEYYYTSPRINVLEGKVSKSTGRKVDYILSCKPNLPIAIVEAKDDKHKVSDGIQQAMGYALDLDIPFAYSSNGAGFFEHDMITGEEREIKLEDFPTPDDLWKRYLEEKNITPEQEDIIKEPYYFLDVNKTPRYYQRIAINRTVEAVVKGDKRVLLVMATGTGKTFTAFQIIHKLWKKGKAKKVLYLADRNILIDQTIQNDFKPFQKVMTKIEGRKMDSAYQIYMSLYHQLKSNEQDAYKEFKRDFFDLIIVDECHRSSAAEDSNWHEILQYFDSATQIGMTATPKETKDVSNITYFGDPVYVYSLKQGIEDGYLAPYQVICVELDKDLHGYTPEPGAFDENGEAIENKTYTTKDFDRTIVIDDRTKVVAKRITEFLKATDRMAKTIVFCVDSEHALRMRHALAKENIDMMKENPNYVTRITANDKEGLNQLDNFMDVNERYPVIATTSQLLSTGVDTRTVKLIVLDKNIGSMTEFKQIIGRGTRLVPKKGKEFFTIMDFRNNAEHFDDPDFDGEPISKLKIDGGNGEKSIPSDVYNQGNPTQKNPREGLENDDKNDDKKPFKKLYINDVEVTIEKETVKYIDANTGELKIESIKDYSKKNLLRLYSTYGAFNDAWNTNVNKGEFIDELNREGVLTDILEEEVNDNNIDIYDILGNLGYNETVINKQERAEKVLKSGAFDDCTDFQKSIIEALIDTYERKDVREMEKINVLDINVFKRKFGGLIPVIKNFGGKQEYLEKVNTIKTLLYS